MIVSLSTAGKMEDGLLSLKWNNHKSTFFQVLSILREKVWSVILMFDLLMCFFMEIYYVELIYKRHLKI